MSVEDKLNDAHSRAAKMTGQMSLSISKRNIKKHLLTYWVKELRQAADILEQLIPQRVDAGKKEQSRDQSN